MNFRNLLPLVVLALASCGDGHQPSSDTAGDEALKGKASEVTEVDPMADFKFHRMIANLPSPMETFEILSATEVNLAPVELTPVDKANGLSTMSKKAFGYGVYITDMGFLAYEESNQQTLTYLQTCRQLAQELGAGEVFDRNIAHNFEENATSQEKFINMMDQGFKAMDEYMQTNERFLNATEIFVGSWVESQLIATRLLRGNEMNEANRSIYEGIYSQKMHASNLMNVLGEVDSQIDANVHSAVEDLMMFYAGFSNPESITQADLAELEQKLVTLKHILLG